MIKTARTPADFKAGAALFRQYAADLTVDLSFQDFGNEVNHIHQKYSLPNGVLFLAEDDQRPVACAGLRRLDIKTVELKRMFVMKEHRGKGIGKSLLSKALETAEEQGYDRMVLDSLPDMKAAQALYISYGFYRIAPYYHSPVEGTAFFEKRINTFFP